MKYRYAIYFTWNDSTEDSFNVCDAKERDINIKDMIKRGDFLADLMYLVGTAYQNRRISLLGQLNGYGLAQASAGTRDEDVAFRALLRHGWMFFL